jgi:hypothetical protein
MRYLTAALPAAAQGESLQPLIKSPCKVMAPKPPEVPEDVAIAVARARLTAASAIMSAPPSHRRISPPPSR